MQKFWIIAKRLLALFWLNIKEPLRITVFLLVGETIVLLSDSPQTPTLIITLLILKTIDKTMHEIGARRDNISLDPMRKQSLLTKGITRF